MLPRPHRLQSSASKLGLMLLIVVLDQATKMYALSHFKGVAPRSYVGDLFRIDYAENPGAFLSLGAQLSEEMRFWVFVLAVGLFVGYVLWVIFRDRTLDGLSVFSWCMIAAGGVGNLIDRSTRPNHGVIDFMNMGIGSLRTGIFNVADMAIMLGVILLGFQFVLRGITEPKTAE